MADIQKILAKGDAFKKNPEIALVREFTNLSTLLEGVIKAIEASKTESVQITNPEAIKPEPINLNPIKEAINEAIGAIKGIQSPDLAGIEKLLTKISEKEAKDLDLSELTKISGILGAVNDSINAIKVPDTDHVKQIVPNLKGLQDTLKAINDNIVALEIPEFDYEKLEEIVKKIRIGGGGGGPSSVNVNNTSANPVNVTGTFTPSGTQDVNLTKVGGNAVTTTVPISATTLPLPTGAATAAKQLPDNHQVTVSNFPATQPISGTVTANKGTGWVDPQTDALTNTQLRASPVPVSGTVTSTPSGTQNVDVVGNTIGLSTSAKQDTLLAELQLKADLTETQPVSLASVPSHPVTNAGTFPVQATLAAETTKVIGTVNQGTSPWVVSLASTTITGSVAVTGTFFQATQPVSGTFFQATQPISGTVTANINGLPAMTNTQLDIGTSQVATPTSNLTSRKTISIKALAANAQKVYVGLTGVSSSNGYELSAGDSIELDVDATVNLFTIAASGTQRISIIEVA